MVTGRFAPKSSRPVVSPQALGRFAPTKVVSPPVVSLPVEVVSPPVNSRKKKEGFIPIQISWVSLNMILKNNIPRC